MGGGVRRKLKDEGDRVLMHGNIANASGSLGGRAVLKAVAHAPSLAPLRATQFMRTDGTRAVIQERYVALHGGDLCVAGWCWVHRQLERTRLTPTRTARHLQEKSREMLAKSLTTRTRSRDSTSIPGNSRRYGGSRRNQLHVRWTSTRGGGAKPGATFGDGTGREDHSNL